MIDDTIASIENRLRQAGGLTPEQRSEMTALLGQLKSELSELSKTNAEQARSVAGYIDASTHELTRQSKQPESLRQAIDGLSESILGLEVQHPRLTELVNSFSMILSNTGI